MKYKVIKKIGSLNVGDIVESYITKTGEWVNVDGNHAGSAYSVIRLLGEYLIKADE